jgi:hypothetical protein
MSLTKTVTVWVEEPDADVEVKLALPARYFVCSDCRGTGKTYLGWRASEQPAFSREDFDEQGPEFFEEYVSGAYDRCCSACNGQRVTLEIDCDAAESTARHDPEFRTAYEAWIAQENEEAGFRAMQESERRMGA